MNQVSVSNPEVVIPCEVRCVEGGWKASVGVFAGYGPSRPDAIRALHGAIVNFAQAHEFLYPQKRDDLSFDNLECHAS